MAFFNNRKIQDLEHLYKINLINNCLTKDLKIQHKNYENSCNRSNRIYW